MNAAEEILHLLLSYNFDSLYRIHKKGKYISSTPIVSLRTDNCSSKQFVKLKKKSCGRGCHASIFVGYYTVARR